MAPSSVERGRHVVIDCRDAAERITERFGHDTGRGIERVRIQVAARGPRGTLEFDALSAHRVARSDATCLVLGHHGAVFPPYLRLRGRELAVDMDGIGWRRLTWNPAVRAWVWANERIAAWTAQRLVGDRPVIADHLATPSSRRAIAAIPQRGDPIASAPEAPIAAMSLAPDGYLVSTARIEPGDGLLSIVATFSRRRRDARLVVLGTLDDTIPYHRAVRAVASAEVVFPGAIDDAATVQALRFHARACVHGHTVGGTNPSLVEALRGGSAVIARRNADTCRTAGAEQWFFDEDASLERAITAALTDTAAVTRARAAARRQAERLVSDDILGTYERELLAPGTAREPAQPAEAAVRPRAAGTSSPPPRVPPEPPTPARRSNTAWMRGRGSRS